MLNDDEDDDQQQRRQNMIKRTMTMTWDGLAGLDEEDDDRFFDSTNRISTIVPIDLLAPHSSPSSSDDDNDETFDDPRISFTSAASSLSFRHPTTTTTTSDDYNIWMAAPGSIKERRRRLLQGLGLNSNRDLLRLTTFTRNNDKPPPPQPPLTMTTTTMDEERGSETQTSTSSPSLSPSPCNVGMVLIRSRSDGDMEYYSADTKKRKEAMIGANVSKQRLTRTSSNLAPRARICKVNANAITIVKNDVCSGCGGSEKKGSTAGALMSTTSNRQFGAFFLIKNLDTGKEFIVKEFDEDGMWNRLSDLQTGKQLTMEEFEKSVGTSPVVKELMRRQNVGRSCENGGVDHKMSAFARSFR